jgi:hypothetical protein
MEEPLLAAVVSNKAKSPIPDESFDRAACHANLLGARTQGRNNQDSFRRTRSNFG